MIIAPSSSVNAQGIAGARATAMSGVSLGLQDVWSGFHNQANLVSLSGVSAGVFAENRFDIKQLGDKGLVAALPFRHSAVGITYRSFGYHAYRNSKFGIAYAIELAEKFALGVQMNYHQIQFGQHYGRTGALSVEGGFIYRMTQQLNIAVHITNPTRAKLDSYNDVRLPTLLRMGLGYLFSEKVYTAMEVRKSDMGRAAIHAAIEYSPIAQFFLRGGVSTEPSGYSFGFGYRWTEWQGDIAAGYHPVLGFTPQLSITHGLQKQ